MKFFKQNPRAHVAGCVVSIGLVFSVSPVTAEQTITAPQFVSATFDIESDGADRIHAVGQLRTLTQQVAAASCALATDIETDNTRRGLRLAMTDFDRYLTALRDGDAALNILAPESRRQTIASIDAIGDEWSKVQLAVGGILEATDDATSRQIVDDHSAKLLALADVLAADITGQYAHPYEVTTADALLIEFVGRQQMLIHKMAHGTCQVWSGNGSIAAKEQLRDTMNMFEASLNALRYGMPELGVRAAPNDAIRSDLDQLTARWETVKANGQMLLDADTLDRNQSAAVYHTIEVELAAFDGLLDDYRQHAERAH